MTTAATTTISSFISATAFCIQRRVASQRLFGAVQCTWFRVRVALVAMLNAKSPHLRTSVTSATLNTAECPAALFSSIADPAYTPISLWCSCWFCSARVIVPLLRRIENLRRMLLQRDFCVPRGQSPRQHRAATAFLVAVDGPSLSPADTTRNTHPWGSYEDGQNSQDRYAL